MNKQKLKLYIIGGVIGLAVLASVVMTYLAYSAKCAAMDGDDETEGLESLVNDASSLSRKAVYPCKASVEAINANTAKVDEWRQEALRFASRGDRMFEKTTAAAFKEFLIADAKRLAMLPGGVDGRIAKGDFDFGPFKDYITGGSMPDSAHLGELQRQWDDIAGFIELISTNGAAEVTSVSLAANAVAKNEEANPKKTKAKKQNVKKSAKKDAAEEKAPSIFTYQFSFNAKPDAFVKIVNALAKNERFYVVEDFTLMRSKDMITDALGNTGKTEEAQPTGRRRRRGAAAVEEKTEEKPKGDILITDPQRDPPIMVTMKVSITDFRSVEENKED